MQVENEEPEVASYEVVRLKNEFRDFCCERRETIERRVKDQEIELESYREYAKIFDTARVMTVVIGLIVAIAIFFVIFRAKCGEGVELLEALLDASLLTLIIAAMGMAVYSMFSTLYKLTMEELKEKEMEVAWLKSMMLAWMPDFLDQDCSDFFLREYRTRH